jgi:hypothetical protein
MRNPISALNLRERGRGVSADKIEASAQTRAITVRWQARSALNSLESLNHVHVTVDGRDNQRGIAFCSATEGVGERAVATLRCALGDDELVVAMADAKTKAAHGVTGGSISTETT